MMKCLNKFKIMKIILGLFVIIFFTNIKSKTLVYCSEGSPEGFNPQLFSSGITYDASSVPIYNRLVEFKLGTSEIEPGLAKTWNISADGKEYTFILRKGVQWHSNKYFKPTRELNADDIFFSFDRQLNKNNKYHNVSGGHYEYFAGMGMDQLIIKIEKIDNYTIRFVLSRRDATFLSNLAMDFASIFSKEYADNMLKLNMPEKIDLNPIGTGPFQFLKYEKDSRILYKANQNYWKNKPKIDFLIFSITPDASIRYAKLQKNECQVMSYPDPADIARMMKNKHINLMKKNGLNVSFISFNTAKKPFDNVLMRKALTIAVNKKAIINAIYQGAGRSAKNVIPPNMWSYNSDIKDYSYDPIKAKKILKKIDLPTNFSIDLWAMPVQRPYNPNARRMAEMIQADWMKIGIKTNIITYEWGEYLKRAKSGEHEVIMAGWSSDNGNPDNFLSTLFSCTAAKYGSNYSHWCNKSFERQIQLASTQDSDKKRIKYYKKAQIILHQQLPALMIAHSTIYEPISKKISGYIVDPLGKHHFDNVDIKE
ncbi:MAG: ABC transporter substrate-binding protein [Pantoea sp. Brub]|nr:ABC transporter substrate-binding protein [Pantoea sp. Brub]